MKKGVCVAGINLDNFKNIRPILFSGSIQMDFVRRNRLYPYAICTFEGMPKINITAPHTEDFTVRDTVEFRRFVTQKEWYEILERCASQSLADVLNDSINEDKWIVPGTGVPSLSLIKLQGKPQIDSIQVKDGAISDIRATFHSCNRSFCLKVNDIQLVDFISKRYGDVVELNEELFKGGQYYVRVGLTRPYREKCWLQINGIYSEGLDRQIRQCSGIQQGK
ncbi:MAG: hypothetical protein L7F77_12700 [Candidatus Magnetominusculus sp. LBB02]|nr:hypothetical protein [Candidatus Magnetominusculus sp. LBB02]